MRYWLALALLAWTAPALGANGTWLTESGGGQVEIGPCGEALCGRIVWLKEPLDTAGQPKRDKENPDPARRERPILGLAMLEGFRPAGENKWADGTIYNPEDGKTYSCTMTLEGNGTLKVRGYVGVPLFGKTQVWTRVK
ncbi:MAG: DUF2147 domain-containing protein [Alphaproteobacteria bacterium]|nr:DUF2147 domain-containing protein [Alphaproteobacteria bacterium]